MKICDLTQAYTDSSGGIRTYIEAKKRHLQQNTDDEHMLIIPAEKDGCEKNERLSTYFVKAPLIPKCAPYRFILRLDKVLRILFREKPDIIELGSGYWLPWAAFVYRLFHRCAVLGFYHTDFPTAYVKPAITGLLNPWWGRLTEKLALFYARLVYRKFDATFVASPNLHAKLTTGKVKNLELVPLGVDLQIFNPEKRNTVLRNHLGLKSNDILLSYVGRLDIEKRVETLINAFHLLPEDERYFLLLVGDGPLREKLLEITRRETRIKIINYQTDREKLAELMASSDVYVTAGPYETFGLCVVEAQACGLPVVGVRAGALLERVPQNMGLLGAVDSAEEMAENIRKLTELNFREMGITAHRWVAENYAWPSICNRIWNVYQKSLPEPATKSVKLSKLKMAEIKY